jgi:hypothetical protein
MRVRGTILVAAMVALLGGVAYGQPPISFALQQNAPDPFCAGQAGGFTTVQFAMAQAAEVTLVVWSPDATAIVRTLVNGSLQAGYHAVAWDGRNESGLPVPRGAYPYRLIAREPGGGTILYDATLVATVSCPVPSEATTWGLLKITFLGALR